MYCGNCGSQIENENAEFCPSCGEPLEPYPRGRIDPKGTIYPRGKEDQTQIIESVLHSDDYQMADNVQEMKCPACGAPIALDAGLETVVCEYCGTKVFVDDEVYKYQRILKAQYEMDKKREGFETRRSVVNALKDKPIECAAVLLCTIWVISGLIRGKSGLSHILIEIGVIIWAIGAKKRPLLFTNLGIYFKNNIKQAIVFVISVMVICTCISGSGSVALFLFALWGLVWSIKSGKKVEMIIDEDKYIRYIYPHSSANSYIGRQNTVVMEELRACGFSNITTIQKKDLVKGWLAKAGEVASISINGNRSFEEGQEFPSDAKVVIEYHAFQ